MALGPKLGGIAGAAGAVASKLKGRKPKAKKKTFAAAGGGVGPAIGGIIGGGYKKKPKARKAGGGPGLRSRMK